jgi:hypothetical protein
MSPLAEERMVAKSTRIVISLIEIEQRPIHALRVVESTVGSVVVKMVSA